MYWKSLKFVWFARWIQQYCYRVSCGNIIVLWRFCLAYMNKGINIDPELWHRTMLDLTSKRQTFISSIITVLDFMLYFLLYFLPLFPIYVCFSTCFVFQVLPYLYLSWNLTDLSRCFLIPQEVSRLLCTLPIPWVQFQTILNPPLPFPFLNTGCWVPF